MVVGNGDVDRLVRAYRKGCSRIAPITGCFGGNRRIADGLMMSLDG